MNDSIGLLPAAEPAAAAGETLAASPRKQDLDDAAQDAQEKRNGTTQYASVRWDNHDVDHDHHYVRTKSRAPAARFSVMSAPPATSSFRRANGHHHRVQQDENDVDPDPLEGDQAEQDEPATYVSRPSRHSWDIKGKGRARQDGDKSERILGEGEQRSSRPASLVSLPKHFSWESPDPGHQKLRSTSASQTHDRDGNLINIAVTPRPKRRSNTWAPMHVTSLPDNNASSSGMSEADDPAQNGYVHRAHSSHSARRSRTPSPVLSKHAKRCHLPRSASEVLPSSASSPSSRHASRRQTPRSGSPMAFAQIRPMQGNVNGQELPFSRPSSSSNLSAVDAPAQSPQLRKRTSGLHMRARSGSRSTQASRQVSEILQHDTQPQARKRTKSTVNSAVLSLQNSPSQSVASHLTARTFSTEGTRQRKSSSSRVAFPTHDPHPQTGEAAVINDEAALHDVSEASMGMSSSRSRPFSIAALMQEENEAKGRTTPALPEPSLLDIIKQVDVKAAHALFKEVQANAQNVRQASVEQQRRGSLSLSPSIAGDARSADQIGRNSRVSSQPSTSSIRDNSTISTRAPLLPKSPTISNLPRDRRGSIHINMDEPATASPPKPAAEAKKKRRLSNFFGGTGKKEKARVQEASDDDEQAVGGQDIATAIKSTTPAMERYASLVKTELENRYQPVFTAIALGRPPPNPAEVARWRYRRAEIAARRKQLTQGLDGLDNSASTSSLAQKRHLASPTLVDRLRGDGQRHPVWEVRPKDFATFAEVKGAMLEAIGDTEDEQGDVFRQAVGPSSRAFRRPQYYRHASSEISLRSLESIHEGQLLGSSFDERLRTTAHRQRLKGSLSREGRSLPGSRGNSMSQEEGLLTAEAPSTPQGTTSPYSSRHGHTPDRALSPRSSLGHSHSANFRPDRHQPSIAREQQGIVPSPPRSNKGHHVLSKSKGDLVDGQNAYRHDHLMAASPTSGPSDSETGIDPARSRTHTEPKPPLSRQSSRSSSVVNFSKILPNRRTGRAEAEGYKSMDEGEATDKSFTARFGRRKHMRASLPVNKGKSRAGVLSGEESALEDTVEPLEDSVHPSAFVQTYDVFEDIKQPRSLTIADVDEEELTRGQDLLHRLTRSLERAHHMVPQIPLHLQKVVGDFHTLNIERLHKGQLAELEIAEPTCTEDLHGIVLPAKPSPRARQSSQFQGTISSPERSIIQQNSENDLSDGTHPPAHTRLRSWTEESTLEDCVSWWGEQNERQADLQRSRTRRRVPHLDHVSKQLEQAHETLVAAKTEAQRSWLLHDEVNASIRAAKELVNDHTTYIATALDPEISGIQNTIAEIWDARNSIHPFTFREFLENIITPVIPVLLFTWNIIYAISALINRLRYLILSACVMGLISYSYRDDPDSLRDVPFVLLQTCKVIFGKLQDTAFLVQRITTQITTTHK